MSELDPAGPILSRLFDAPESDTVVKLVDLSGLAVDWTLDESRFWTHKTRKREYRLRISRVLEELAPEKRRTFASKLAVVLVDAGVVTLDSTS
jgi:hypothetical protein